MDQIVSGLTFLLSLCAVGCAAVGFISLGVAKTNQESNNAAAEGRMMGMFYGAAAFTIAAVIVGTMNWTYGG